MDRKILIVDDEDKIRLLYKKELIAAGYKVDVAGTGQEAIDKSTAGDYALIVLDIEMPDMSGLDVLNAIKEKSPQSNVIINSAYTIYKSDFQSWLADAYVVKSSDLNPLKSKIEEILKP